MQFDLIVVGGGHNGLVCAAYAADAGLKVAVVERHERVGGAAITEEFHPGYRNSAASYTVSLLEPSIIRDLGLSAHGLRIVPRPLDNFVPAREGPGLELPGSRAELLAAVARFSRRDAAAYERFAGELNLAIRLVRPLLSQAPVAALQGLGELRRSLVLASRSLALGPKAVRSTLNLFRRSAGSWLDAFFEGDQLKGALGFDSIVGHFASPYTKGSAYLLLHHAFGEVGGRRGAWGHAVGGMGSISDALAGAAVQHGVEIRTGEAVEQIVSAANGFEVQTTSQVLTSRAVAGAVHPKTLFLDLLPGATLPRKFRRRIENWRSESASFRMNVALSELPDFRCLPGTAAARHHGAGILITPSLSYLDRAFQDAVAAGISADPVIELVIPSVIDDTLAPPGRHVASLFCQHFRYDLPGGRSWSETRDVAVDRILDTVDEYAPNFRRSIVGRSALSPVDLERRFGLVGGDIFHGAMTWDQLYHRRPASGYARYRSPVPNLYLCASGAHPGGGVSGLPGRNAAHAIIEDLRVATRRP